MAIPGMQVKQNSTHLFFSKISSRDWRLDIIETAGKDNTWTAWTQEQMPRDEWKEERGM